MNALTSLSIYHTLVQTIPGDTGGSMMPDQVTASGWAVVIAVSTAFVGSVTAVSRWAGPLITLWVQSRAAKAAADAKIAEDLLSHQAERDERDRRMERRIDRLTSVVFKNCGQREEPPSDVDLEQTTPPPGMSSNPDIRSPRQKNQ